MILMKTMLLYLVFILMPFLINSVEHEKSFLIQEDVTNGIFITLYQDSVLFTSSNDLVQKDIETGSIQRTLRAHTNAIYALTVVEETQLITAGWDDMIVHWDLVSGSVIRRIRLGSTESFIKSMSYENGQIFVGGADQFVRRIDLPTGRIIRSWFYTWFINAVLVKDNFLYVGKQSFTSQIEKISVSTSEVVLTFEGHTTGASALCFANNLLISGSLYDSIISWDPDTGNIVKKFTEQQQTTYSMLVHERVLFSAGFDNIIKWDIDSGQLIKVFPALHTNIIRSIVYRNGTLFSGSDDTQVIRWNATDATPIFTYEGRKKALFALVLWKSFVVCGGEDGIIRSWDVSMNSIEPLLSVSGHFKAINCMAIFEDSLFSGGFDTIVRQWNLTDFYLVRSFKGHTLTVGALIADSNYLFSGGHDLKIKQWEISSSTAIGEFVEHTDEITSLQLSETSLISSSHDSKILFWNLDTRESFRTMEFPTTVFAVHVAGETLFSGSIAGVHAFSIATGSTLAFQLENIGCISVVSRDNGVITGHQDSLVRARDINSLTIVGIFQGHQDSVRSLSFDITGTLYTSSIDGSVKRWNMASRKVAFSFENRNSSVTTLIAVENYLYTGLKSGTVNRFDIRNATLDRSIISHRGAVTSFVHVNGSVYSTGTDGNIVQFPSNREEGHSIIFQSSHSPIRSLAYSAIGFSFLQEESKISVLANIQDAEVSRAIMSSTPILCIATYQSFVISGSKSGIIFVWNMDELNLEYELRGHTSQVNMVLVDKNSLYSASDDKTVIIWSLEEKSIVRTLQRLSASALGHLGPVNAISVCSGLLFSVGSDVTTRRWNIQTGRHDGVYFGFSKPVTAVLCHNRTVFAGSEDFSVLYYKPNIPEDVIPSTSKNSQRRTTNRGRNTRVVRKQQTVSPDAFSALAPIVGASAGFVALLIVLAVFYMFGKARSKKAASPTDRTTENETNETTMDLQTVVNSVMGISRHAEYLLPPSIIAKVKKLAAGGGGEIFVAKAMDPIISKKFGDIVIQKVVFVNSKSTEESFFQEVGIMIMLSAFPHFCEIIGYTDKPLSMILKYYPDGSLTEWLRNNSYDAKIMVKCTREISKALKVMHSHYLAHCDLKTQNVLVSVEKGVPLCYLTDFGITQVLSDKILASAMFQVVNLRGLSVPYASPEAFINFRSKNYSNIAFKTYDIYSFSMIMYEILSKRTPWK